MKKSKKTIIAGITLAGLGLGILVLFPASISSQLLPPPPLPPPESWCPPGFDLIKAMFHPKVDRNNNGWICSKLIIRDDFLKNVYIDDNTFPRPIIPPCIKGNERACQALGEACQAGAAPICSALVQTCLAEGEGSFACHEAVYSGMILCQQGDTRSCQNLGTMCLEGIGSACEGLFTSCQEGIQDACEVAGIVCANGGNILFLNGHAEFIEGCQEFGLINGDAVSGLMF